MDDELAPKADSEGTQQVVPSAMQVLARLPALKIRRDAMMHNMHQERHALASTRLEQYPFIMHRMPSMSTLIAEIMQSVSVEERKVRRLEARNKALRRENKRLLRKLTRSLQGPRAIQIPSDLLQTCHQKNLDAECSHGSMASDSPSGAEFDGGVAVSMHQKAKDYNKGADTTSGDESMGVD
ncbi:hypothetical protein HPB51_029770 [Rhipicephalus microplus]|uniref:Uncharacterized protein n=1 Tax=Rhipicephalus microplus TaxID=6941 RepID=A0A9J6CTK2_RHIMP|nr:hypothetical protein HPB51_029770 [Rhipicephalus microplus]